MKTSNLAECFEDFASIIITVDAPEAKAPRIVALEDRGMPRRAPRRSSFESRRIQIRDTGLRHFRVF